MGKTSMGEVVPSDAMHSAADDRTVLLWDCFVVEVLGA